MFQQNRNTHRSGFKPAGLLTLLVVLAVGGAAAASNDSDQAIAEPASAFPADTLLYVEVRDPVAVLDTLSRMTFWPHVVSLINEASGLLGCPGDASQHLVEGLSSWSADSEFRRDLQQLAVEREAFAERLVFGLVPVEGTDRIVPLVLLDRGASVDGRPSLAEKPAFQKIMSDLPSTANARAYIDSAGIMDWIDRSSALSPLGKRLARACLVWTDAFGIAREIGPDSIRTTMTGRLHHEELNAAIPGLLDALVPIEEPISRWFPREALVTYEASVPPEAMLDAVGFFIKTVSPWLNTEIERLRADFTAATGLDPDTDLFPHLGRSVAFAALPSDGEGSEWPFPRSVIMVRVNDIEKARAFASSFLEWDATMWAPLSGGLIGGRAVTGSHDDIELLGIELDSVISLPLPSPTVAFVDGFLIASSFRSGVIDTIASLRGTQPAISAAMQPAISADSIPEGAVELVHLNCPAWKSSWARCWKAAAGPCSTLLLDREFRMKHQIDGERLDRLGDALCGIVTSLDRATGTTVIDSGGRFEFFIEVRVR